MYNSRVLLPHDFKTSCRTSHNQSSFGATLPQSHFQQVAVLPRTCRCATTITKESRLLRTESPGNEPTRRRTRASEETTARRESLSGVSKAEWQWARCVRNADTGSL